MNTRALHWVSLWVGILLTIVALVMIRQTHTEERAMELAMIAALAIGGFLLISGLIGTLTEPPRPAFADDEPDDLPAQGRPVSVSTAIGVYLFAIAVIAGIVVGIFAEDVGAAIQTFTFGVILGGVIWGLGLLLGYRPAEDDVV